MTPASEAMDPRRSQFAAPKVSGAKGVFAADWSLDALRAKPGAHRSPSESFQRSSPSPSPEPAPSLSLSAAHAVRNFPEGESAPSGAELPRAAPSGAELLRAAPSGAAPPGAAPLREASSGGAFSGAAPSPAREEWPKVAVAPDWSLEALRAPLGRRGVTWLADGACASDTAGNGHPVPSRSESSSGAAQSSAQSSAQQRGKGAGAFGTQSGLGSAGAGTDDQVQMAAVAAPHEVFTTQSRLAAVADVASPCEPEEDILAEMLAATGYSPPDPWWHHEQAPEGTPAAGGSSFGVPAARQLHRALNLLQHSSGARGSLSPSQSGADMSEHLSSSASCSTCPTGEDPSGPVPPASRHPPAATAMAGPGCAGPTPFAEHKAAEAAPSSHLLLTSLEEPTGLAASSHRLVALAESTCLSPEATDCTPENHSASSFWTTCLLPTSISAVGQPSHQGALAATWVGPLLQCRCMTPGILRESSQCQCRCLPGKVTVIEEKQRAEEGELVPLDQRDVTLAAGGVPACSQRKRGLHEAEARSELQREEDSADCQLALLPAGSKRPSRAAVRGQRVHVAEMLKEALAKDRVKEEILRPRGVQVEPRPVPAPGPKAASRKKRCAPSPAATLRSLPLLGGGTALSGSTDDCTGSEGAGASSADIRAWLLNLAQAVTTGNQAEVDALARVLTARASPFGAPMERMAHLMLHTLEKRLKGFHLDHYVKWSPAMDVAMKSMSFTAKEPKVRFGFLSTAAGIVDVVADEARVHLVDFSCWGGQWPIVIRQLASRPLPGGIRRQLKFTAVAAPPGTPGPAGPLFDVLSLRAELTAACEAHDMDLKFQAVFCAAEDLRPQSLALEHGEAVVVNMCTRLMCIPTSTSSILSDPMNLKDSALKAVLRLQPRAVLLLEWDCNLQHPSFLSRFRQVVDYFTAMFDSHEPLAARDDEARSSYEYFYVKEMLNMVASEGIDRVVHPESLQQLQARMVRLGFIPRPYSARAMLALTEAFAGLPKGYSIGIDAFNGCRLEWHDYSLLAASLWQPKISTWTTAMPMDSDFGL